MIVKYYIRRIKKYYKENGLHSLFKRLAEVSKRRIFQNRNIIYFFESKEIQKKDLIKPIGIKVFQRRAIENINENELNVLNEYLGSTFIVRTFSERYKEGATIWTIYKEEKFVGYLWTIQGKPLKNHCFYHITSSDIEIFDVVIFAKYRGSKIYSKSVELLFKKFIEQKIDRVFTKIKVWNKSAIKAAAGVRWKKFGIASQIKFLKFKIIIWYKKF